MRNVLKDKCWRCEHTRDCHVALPKKEFGRCWHGELFGNSTAPCDCPEFQEWYAAHVELTKKRKKFEKQMLDLAIKRGELIDAAEDDEALTVESRATLAGWDYYKTVKRLKEIEADHESRRGASKS